MVISNQGDYVGNKIFTKKERRKRIDFSKEIDVRMKYLPMNGKYENRLKEILWIYFTKNINIYKNISIKFLYIILRYMILV